MTQTPIAEQAITIQQAYKAGFKNGAQWAHDPEEPCHHNMDSIADYWWLNSIDARSLRSPIATEAAAPAPTARPVGEDLKKVREALERSNAWIMKLIKKSPEEFVYEPINDALATIDTIIANPLAWLAYEDVMKRIEEAIKPWVGDYCREEEDPASTAQNFMDIINRIAKEGKYG